MSNVHRIRHLTEEDIAGVVANLACAIEEAMGEAFRHDDAEGGPLPVYAVPRGGLYVATYLQRCLSIRLVAKPEDAAVVIDDIIDSGKTAMRYASKGHLVLGLYGRQTWPLYEPREDMHGVPTMSVMEHTDDWLVFPWEGDEEGSAEDIVLRLLQYVGEDTNREGLRETPARVLKAWREWTAGYGQEPRDILKTFEDGAEKIDELILVRDIPMWSHCEHHLAPFFGVAHIGYIPNGKIVGLSKLARLVDVFGRRLQVQERLTAQIADAISEVLEPKGVGVVIEARHMCMESRGIRRVGATTVTSAMRGALLDKPEARAEFLAMIRG